MMTTPVLESLSIYRFDGEKISPDPAGVNGGDGILSYNKNSYYQRLAVNAVKGKIVDAITRKLDLSGLSSGSNTIRLADLGCAVGSNTLNAMQDVLEVIKKKYQSQFPSSKIPEFQVFFNDQTSNDFNTLFNSLPKEREYFAAGVPGSFHHRLFPKSSMHFVHSSYALHWLSKVPEELLDNNSPAWNKGRVHYANAAEEVVNAYASQFAKDMESFLNARAEEIVSGGMMVMIKPGVPNAMPYAQLTNGVMYDFMGSVLMEMAKEGLITEAQVDNFNLPVYSASPEEMVKLVKANGHFSIESIELTNPAPWLEDSVDIKSWTMHVKAAMEGMFTKHFHIEIVDKMFDRLIKKLCESSDQVESGYKEKTQLFVVLMRK